MEGGWSGDDDDDGDDLPSPEAKTASRLALLKKNKGWQRLHDDNWEKRLLFWGFRIMGINRGPGRAPEEVGAPRQPPGAATGGAASSGRLGPLRSTSGTWKPLFIPVARKPQ